MVSKKKIVIIIAAIIAGIVIIIAAITAAVLYAVMSGDPVDPAMASYVNECRDLARQTMDIAISTAESGVDPTFEPRIIDNQIRMESLGCTQNEDEWLYGSFLQEMIEKEERLSALMGR